MKTTTYDVAGEEKISPSDVPKAKNPRQVVRKSKQKVLKMIEELKDKSVTHAPDLTEKQTSAIGFLLPNLASPFHAEIARQVEGRAYEAGYNLIICSTDFQQEKEEKYISLLREKKVDGFILAGGFSNKEVLVELIEKDVPVILLAGESHPVLPVNTVTIDNFTGGYEVTSHLIGFDHARIGIIAEASESSREQIRGYRKALQDNNLECDEDLVAISDSSIENAQRLTMQWLDSPAPPTAIISSNDVLAMGVLLGARKKKVNVPKELSITGFDNILLSRYCDPPLTTIEHPIQSMCNQAVDLLLEEIEETKKEKQKILMLPKLIVRQSTGYRSLKKIGEKTK